MTAHQLARELLKLRDVDVVYNEGDHEQAWVDVIAIHYDERQKKVLLV